MAKKSSSAASLGFFGCDFFSKRFFMRWRLRMGSMVGVGGVRASLFYIQVVFVLLVIGGSGCDSEHRTLETNFRQICDFHKFAITEFLQDPDSNHDLLMTFLDLSSTVDYESEREWQVRLKRVGVMGLLARLYRQEGRIEEADAIAGAAVRDISEFEGAEFNYVKSDVVDIDTSLIWNEKIFEGEFEGADFLDQSEKKDK
ncbi:MAG: hypothetical protein V3V20_09995 [Algisphaera sp.]